MKTHKCNCGGHPALPQAPWLGGVYQEVDGFFYFDPLTDQGCYSAHTLREMADYLDAKNKPWQEQINKKTIPTCKMCGEPIRYTGGRWEHTNGTPRHPATPADA
jgi:hypothetical protein